MSDTEVGLLSLLTEKVKGDPFRLVTLLIFLGALVHTFLAGKFARKAKTLEQHAGVTVRSQCLHWLGYVLHDCRENGWKDTGIWLPLLAPFP